MKNVKYLISFFLIISPVTASAWQWMDLWQTPDQKGISLLRAGDAQAAAKMFNNKNWRTVADYRAGNYQQAFKQFSENKSSDGQYNAGNAAAFMGEYQDAISAYDKAIALNPDNTDAITNREIIKKLLQQQKNNTSSNNQNNKNNSANQQNNDKQQSGQQNSADKQKQQNSQSNSPSSRSQQQANNTQQDSSTSMPQKTGDPSQNTNAQSTATSKQQRQDESSKQLLRSLPDDPGGLLQQKFLREYARRHGVDVSTDQGEN